MAVPFFATSCPPVRGALIIIIVASQAVTLPQRALLLLAHVRCVVGTRIEIEVRGAVRPYIIRGSALGPGVRSASVATAE